MTAVFHRSGAGCGGYPSNPPHILIAGIGNELLMDDGVGVCVVRELQRQGHFAENEHVMFAEIGTFALDALHLLEWADVVFVVDTMRAGGPPGEAYLTTGTEIESGPLRGSLHHLDLLGALHLIPGPPHCPRFIILGVEPARMEFGMELSPRLQERFPEIVELALEVAQSLVYESSVPTPL